MNLYRMNKIIALENDRLDKIAFRIYGNIFSETLRTLFWANRNLPLVIPIGTSVNTPPVETIEYAQKYIPL